MFRRPLRVYLFEILLFLTMAIFFLQIGYVFLPVFQAGNTPEPVSDIYNGHVDTVLNRKEGIIHVAERDVGNNGDTAIYDDAPKYRLRKDRLAVEAAAKADNALKGAKNEQNRKKQKPQENARPQNPIHMPQNPLANAKVADVNPPQNQGAKDEQTKKKQNPKKNAKPQNSIDIPQNHPVNAKVADVNPQQNQGAKNEKNKNKQNPKKNEKPQNPIDIPQNPPANAKVADVNPPQNQGAKNVKTEKKQNPKKNTKPQNPIDIPQNPPANAKVADAKPQNADTKPKAAVVQPKRAAPPQKEAVNKCTMSVLVLGGMKIVEEWSELTTFVKFLKLHTINKGVTYRAPIYCPQHDCTIELTFSSNFKKQVPGKNAVILNVAPYTLLTHMTKLLKHDNFPDKQLWLLYGVETALRIHKWMKHIGDLRIHGTWSYQSDSEIYMPYAYYQPGEPVTDKKKKSNKYWGKDKTSLVAWMGSNCVKEVFWPRMEYIEELQKHIHVDTYGKCGNLTCVPRLSEECKNLMSSYKFYLAFENAECDEYITEKMWDTALQHGVVPVVYGAHKADYVRLAPPNSFIYAGDFKSPKALAAYLLKLDKSPSLYAAYFEWRYKGRVVQVYPDLEMSKFCEVIPYVNKARSGKLQKKPVSTFPWFSSCRNPIVKVFNPHDIPTLEDWQPWFLA